MAENWELNSLERRVDALEEKWREAEKEKLRRQMWWFDRIWWTCMVAIVTATITLVVAHAVYHG